MQACGAPIGANRTSSPWLASMQVPSATAVPASARPLLRREPLQGRVSTIYSVQWRRSRRCLTVEDAHGQRGDTLTCLMRGFRH